MIFIINKQHIFALLKELYIGGNGLNTKRYMMYDPSFGL